MLFACLLGNFLTVGAFAFENEPEGFRGLKWGDPPGEDMEFLGKGNGKLQMYIRETDELSLEGVSLDHIVYSFWGSEFMGVGLHFSGMLNFLSLLDACNDKFGFKTEDPEKPFTYYWRGIVGSVYLRYRPMDKDGMLSLNNVSLFSEYISVASQEEENQSNGW